MDARVVVVSDTRVADGPYGIGHLSALGYQVSQASAAMGRPAIKLRGVIKHRTNTPVGQALRSVPLVGRADIVLCYLEKYAMVPAALKARGVAPYASRPLAMIACWLADDLKRLQVTERRRLARRYRSVDLTMVFSANQIDVLVDSGFEPTAVESIPFSFAPEQHVPAPFSARSSRIAAVGFDRGRDYAMLCDAVSGTDLVVDLFCSAGNITGLELPSDVHFRGAVPYEEYRRVIASAGMAVIPTSVMEYPSGQTVALESAATGACLALKSTPALREYFSPETSILLPAGDPQRWREALQRAMGDPALREALGDAARDDVRQRFTYASMWARVDELFRTRGWA